MTVSEPIFTVDLFPALEGKLIELLRSLAPEDWSRPTVAKKWSVKDVVAHLLDGNIKRLSMGRDKFFGLQAPQIDSHQSLLDFINRNNAEWVQAARRISPRVLIDLMEITSGEVIHLFREVDPFAPALFGVSWAGEEQSLNWFDIAREYTERWHHQQQIRVAVDRPGIMEREVYFPVLDTFLRGLPHAFRSVSASQGTVVEVVITGEAGGKWYLRRDGNGWQLSNKEAGANSTLVISQDIAWRVFTKAVAREEAAAQVNIAGDRALALHCLNLIAVVA